MAAAVKDWEWKKWNSYHQRHHKLGYGHCFLSFAVDLLKLSYCKMCLMISNILHCITEFFICFNFDSCRRKFEIIESKFPLSGQLDLNKNKRETTVTINLANVQTYACPTPCPVKKKKV